MTVQIFTNSVIVCLNWMKYYNQKFKDPILMCVGKIVLKVYGYIGHQKLLSMTRMDKSQIYLLKEGLLFLYKSVLK